jgi:hypothetical protein
MRFTEIQQVMALSRHCPKHRYPKKVCKWSLQMKLLQLALNFTTRITLACFAMLGLMTTSALAESDDTIFGTYWVKFQPMQAGGELQGCELVYMAVTADFRYRDGYPVAVNGSISISKAPNNNLGLMLKVGLKDLAKNSHFERPTFAYLQSVSTSSAKARQESFEGENGYRSFVYSVFDPAINEIITDMIKTNKVTIAYNRRKDGMDVLVPLDLLVVDSEITANKTMIRKRSPEAVGGFSGCVGKVIDDVSKQLSEK